MSYDDLKVIEAHRLVRSIATGTPEGATITDALRAARLVDAMAESARERRWVDTRLGPPLPEVVGPAASAVATRSDRFPRGWAGAHRFGASLCRQGRSRAP